MMPMLSTYVAVSKFCSGTSGLIFKFYLKLSDRLTTMMHLNISIVM